MKQLKVIVATLFVAAVMVACGGGASTPGDVVNSYYGEIKKGNVEKALSYTNMTDEKVKQQLEKFEGFQIKVSDYEIVSETIAEDGQSAVVEVKYTFTSSLNADPEEETEKVKLGLMEGKWVILQ